MIDIFGIKLHAYGLLIGVGVFFAWEVAKRTGRVEEKVLEKLMPGLIISGIVGARAYHVIDLWSYYSKNIAEIFYVWNGGLGIWGALVGGVMYLAVFTNLNKLNFLKILDSVIIGVPLAQAIGRLGNWVNGELYGKNGEPLFAWEGGLNICLGIVLIYLARREFLPAGRQGFSGTRNDGLVTGVYLIGYGVIRIYLENFRSDSIIWRIKGIPTAIIFGIISIFAGSFIIMKYSNKKG